MLPRARKVQEIIVEQGMKVSWRNIVTLSSMQLRVKLVISYIAVVLGTILTLTLAIGLAAQSYIASKQQQTLEEQASYWADQLTYHYSHGENWQNVVEAIRAPLILAIADTDGDQPVCIQPAFLSQDNCRRPQLKEALTQALKGQTIYGDFPITTYHNSTYSAAYITVPLQTAEHKTIGAMFLSEPQLRLDSMLVRQVNFSILEAGIVVALLATLFSLYLAHRLTQPLKSLTVAAEQMKQGRYTQRVTPPKTQDEIGVLAQTFNEMAATIEADMNELRLQEQARRELLANIAHDLATPLTAIQGFSEALADDLLPDPVARQETAQRIAREVQRLRRMVAELQQMSSLESGRVQLDLAPLEIHTLVDETLTVLEPECTQKRITLHNEIPSWMPLVRADSDRITQVLLNLLDNARRHTPEGGEICVGAQPQQRELRVWVKDTGEGIDPADLPHIFERFYRADRSRANTTGGSGLGLSIVKAIITAHGGKVWAQSQPGEGTCVAFTLPLV